MERNARYSIKANRDAAFKAAGGTKAGYKKTSITHQHINPKYVADSGVTGPTQFGDDVEYFAALYSFVKVAPVVAAPAPKPVFTEPTFSFVDRVGTFKKLVQIG